MNYEETPQFVRDFKKLLKKFISLEDDLKIAKQYRIELFHIDNIDSKSIFKIEGVSNNKKIQFFKIKKFQCKSLKGRGAKSGIRVIYAFLPREEKIFFLEIYFKGQKENEDRTRIDNFIKKYNETYANIKPR